MKTRTLRGRLLHNEVQRLVVDDGNLNHGYRVKEFYVFPQRSDDSTNDVMGTLALEEAGAQIRWDAGDNRQIGWASTGVGGSRDMHPAFTLIDRDKIILQDLYIYGSGSGSSDGNYLVILETVDLTNDEAVMQLIKERSQNVN